MLPCPPAPNTANDPPHSSASALWDSLPEHDPMPVRGLDHELTVPVGAITQGDGDLASSLTDFLMQLVDLLDHDVKEPGVISSLRCIDLVDTLTEHQLDPVPR